MKRKPKRIPVVIVKWRHCANGPFLEKKTSLITACVNYLKALTTTQYSVCVDLTLRKLGSVGLVCFNSSWTVKFYLPTSRSFVEVRFCQSKVRIRILFTAVFTVKPCYNEGARDLQNMFGRTRFRISKFFSVYFITEPLYEYLHTTISSRVFHYTANRRFFVERNRRIWDWYQEFYCVVTLLTSSVQPQRRQKRENPERAAHFLFGFFGIIAGLTLSNLLEIVMRSRPIFGICRRFFCFFFSFTLLCSLLFKIFS